MLIEMLKNGNLHTLVGLENNDQDGTGRQFNWILSNGARSVQRDKGETYYTHMMPEGSNIKIRSVKIY